MPTAETIRTFLALVVGDETRQRLAAIAAELSPRLVGFKWTKPEQLHLTLAFLGEVDAARIDDLRAALSAAVQSQQPFDLRWQGLGGFPKPNRAHILWAGVSNGAEPLAELQRAVAAALASAGFPCDDRFTPHITLARAKRFGGRPADLRPIVEHFRKTEFGVDRVAEIVVMRSDCRPSGSIYTPLATIPLAGP